MIREGANAYPRPMPLTNVSDELRRLYCRALPPLLGEKDLARLMGVDLLVHRELVKGGDVDRDFAEAMLERLTKKPEVKKSAKAKK